MHEHVELEESTFVFGVRVQARDHRRRQARRLTRLVHKMSYFVSLEEICVCVCVGGGGGGGVGERVLRCVCMCIPTEYLPLIL